MDYLPNFLFAIVLAVGVGFFVRNTKQLIRNIRLGKDVDTSSKRSLRWKNVLFVALGQQKMMVRPIAGILHIVVYVGFLVVNIEVLEIILDGLLGTHRLFSFIGDAYSLLIGIFEILALLVIISVAIFWFRRNILKINRLNKKELQGWAKTDANNILYIEALLMFLFLVMNAADYQLQTQGVSPYVQAGAFPVSQYISVFIQNWSTTSLIVVERLCWWLHIIGILFFLNYLHYSKHLHIFLAFPNTFFASIAPKGQLDNIEAVTKEVQMMLNPTNDISEVEQAPPDKFGASDVYDLSWVQLLSAYTCTECGRCTDECPASQTGKKLSPRHIMMKTRQRLQEVGKNIETNKGIFVKDGKQLLNDYITPEELWACTSCNACVEACPLNINPLSIIIEMRRYLVMEQSAAPSQLNAMMNNIENNGAPWPYSQMDRMNWVNED